MARKKQADRKDGRSAVPPLPVPTQDPAAPQPGTLAVSPLPPVKEKKPSGFSMLLLHVHPRMVPEEALTFTRTCGLGGIGRGVSHPSSRHGGTPPARLRTVRGAGLRLGAEPAGRHRRRGLRLDLGLAYEFLWSGSPSVDVNRGPLAGRVAGNYNNSWIQFVALNATWKF